MTNAWINPLIITCAKSTLNPFATIILFEFGEIIFFTFYPIIAKSIDTLFNSPFLATNKAIGVTIIISTVINTPTEIIIIVTSAITKIALFFQTFLL